MPCVSNRCGGVAAEGKSLAKMYGSKYMEVSAILNHKVDDLLVSAVKQIRLCSGGRRRRYGDADAAAAGNGQPSCDAGRSTAAANDDAACTDNSSTTMRCRSPGLFLKLMRAASPRRTQ